MAIGPISVSAGLVSSLVEGRQTLNDLQRQLATGKLSETYGGLKTTSRITVLSLRSELSSLEGFQTTIRDVNLRLGVVQQTLTRFNDIASQVKTAAFDNPFDLVDGQHTAFQRNAATMFDDMVSLLNQDINGRHLFSGRATETRPLPPPQTLIEGDGTRAGLKQVIAERRQADLGANGLGRLAITAPAADTVRLAQEANGLPFGFSISGVTSTLTGATVTGPAGNPAALDVTFGATPPAANDKVRVTLDLPDGSQEVVELIATVAANPKPGEFAIGANAAATAANFQATLQTEVARLAATSLTAASAITASNEFFAGTTNNPPLRVDGPPFDTATAQIQGTSANTVIAYQGDDSLLPARQSALAKIDSSLVLAYGTRADEEAPRNVLAKLGVLAAEAFDEFNPNDQDRYVALGVRVGRELAFPAGTQSIADMMAELATVQSAADQANQRHTLSINMAQTIISQSEDANIEEVSVQILTMQTRLQASLQTTSILAQLSLVNFI